MTLSALGIFSAAGAGGAVADTSYELIETSIVSGASTSTVTFSSLGSYSGTYKHLQVRAVASSAASNNDARIRLNGITSASYSHHNLVGTGSSVVSAASTSDTSINAFYLGGTAVGAAVIDILDAYSTTKNKTVRLLQGNTGSTRVALSSGALLTTDSITSVSLLSNAGVWAAGSRFSIYGLKG
jgi:hypothetical protein